MLLLYCICQRRQSLNPDLQAVARLNRPHSAWRAGDDDVARQERHAGGGEADDVRTVKNELAGAGVLPQQTVLKRLDGQIPRVQFGLNVRAQRRESIERLGSRVLTF